VRFISRRNVSYGWRCALINAHSPEGIEQGITFAVVTGLYPAASRSTPQPAGCAGWIELHTLQPHAAGRLHPAAISLFPPLFDGFGSPTAQPL